MNLTVEKNTLVLKEEVNRLVLELKTEQLNILRVDNVILREKFYSDVIVEETLTGTIDGNNCIFTSSKNFLAASTTVFINGLRQRRGIDFNETDNHTITFSEAPSNIGYTDNLTIIYIEDIL